MRWITYIILTLIFSLSSLQAQERSPKVGWFLTPEYSLMVHGDHLGHTVGFHTGINILKNHLQIGFFFYGRSGPINGQTYDVNLSEGQTYLGQSTVQVRADHGAFGLMLAPNYTFKNGWEIDVPINIGQMGAGFYLFGDDRLTPDGERVSVWENRLMDNRDAGFSLMFEGGVRLKAPLSEGIKGVLGVHYAYAPTWDTFVGGTDFYNVPRVSLGIQFGN